jgi:hypothetical protein
MSRPEFELAYVAEPYRALAGFGDEVDPAVRAEPAKSARGLDAVAQRRET